jgi:hypothetical protein
VSCLLRSGVALAAGMILCTSALADGDAPANPTLLFFSGVDAWFCGAFANAGGIWAPAGLDHDGFATKLLTNGGIYTYPSGGLHTDVRVTQLSGSVLPGWRMNDDGAFVGLYVGAIAPDYKLSPYDPKSLLRGFYTGAQMSVDAWIQPSPATMIALDGSIASIALIGSARAAPGWRIYDSLYVGPEAQALWCVDYQEWRLGAHVTAFRFGGLEWSASVGAAYDSFNRLGPYVRGGVILRF